jgi:hypothetical protein
MRSLHEIACCLLTAFALQLPAASALAADKNLPPAVQSLVDTTLLARWPQALGFAPVTAVRQEKVDESAALYVVQINYQGFMIFTEQRGVVKLVAYGQQGGEELNKQDGALANWLQALAQQLKATPSKPAMTELPQAQAAQADSVPVAAPLAAIAPLTTTIWGQSGAYNDRTPPDGDTVPSGCIATALAQTLRFFEHPIEPRKTVLSYTHKTTTADGKPFSYGVLSADLTEVHYNWQDMVDKVDSANSPVADLMYHLGVGLRMRYRPGFSSNAYFDDIAPLLRNTFGYEASDQLFRSNYTAQAWQEKIRNELAAQRVVLMCGYDYNAGAGHCWVVDGIDDANFVHMNWGWDGRFNGYFSIEQPAVRGYDFSGSSHIFTLKPSCTVEAAHEVVGAAQVRLRNSGFALSNTFSYRVVGSSSWQVQSSTQSDVVLSGLQANANYEYKVSSQCSKLGRNESALKQFTAPAGVQACAVKGGSSGYEWIQSITVNGNRNLSGANQGYADFSGFAVHGQAGQPLALTLTPGYSVATPYALYWNVWLDTNNDGVFGADDMLWSSRAAGELAAQINLPASLTAGNHRLRIVMSYYAFDAACGQYQYGEVEDYQLSVSP